MGGLLQVLPVHGRGGETVDLRFQLLQVTFATNALDDGCQVLVVAPVLELVREGFGDGADLE